MSSNLTSVLYSRRLLPLAVFVLSLFSMLWHTSTPYISLWDEMYHLSYVEYAFNWQIPVPLDQMGTWSRYVFSCVEVYPNGFVTSLQCGELLPLEAFPEAGRNSSAHWTPIYFVLTGLIMRPVLWLMNLTGLHVGDFWLAARVATTIIWAIGCSILFVGVRRIFGSNTGALSVALICSSLPGFFYSGSFVTPYALAPIAVGIQLITTYQLKQSFKTKFSFSLVPLFLLTGLSIWALPQSILSLVTLAASLLVYLSLNFPRLKHYSSETNYPRLKQYFKSLAFLAIGVVGYLSYSRWTIFQQSRSRPQPNLPEGSFTQLQDNTFGIFESFQFFFWFTWPKSVYLWPFTDAKETALGVFWAAVATGAILFTLLKRNTLEIRFSIAIAFVLISPFIGLVYDLILPFGPPMRYFLPMTILGISFIAGLGAKRLSRFLCLIAMLTYVYSFFLPAFQNLHPL